jgi:predicted transcriptional regulator
MLSPEDRAYLRGEPDFTDNRQKRYERRKAIRERVYNTLLDFSLLYDGMAHDEHERLFSGTGGGWRGLEDEAFQSGVEDAIAFLLRDAGIWSHLSPTAETPVGNIPDSLLLSALSRIGREKGILVDNVELDVDSTQIPVSDALRNLEQGQDLSPRQLGAVLETDAVDTQEIQERVYSMVFDETEDTDEPDDEPPISVVTRTDDETTDE